LNFLTKLFDKKISDTTTDGYNPTEIQQLLNSITNIDKFQYYFYTPGSKYPTQTEKTQNKPINEILTFLDQHFTETIDLHTEIQHKTYKSGKHEIILKSRDTKNEITKLSILEYNKPQNKTENPEPTKTKRTRTIR
jgi:hypothetical protein